MYDLSERKANREKKQRWLLWKRTDHKNKNKIKTFQRPNGSDVCRCIFFMVCMVKKTRVRVRLWCVGKQKICSAANPMLWEKNIIAQSASQPQNWMTIGYLPHSYSRKRERTVGSDRTDRNLPMIPSCTHIHNHIYIHTYAVLPPQKSPHPSTQ